MKTIHWIVYFGLVSTLSSLTWAEGASLALEPFYGETWKFELTDDQESTEETIIIAFGSTIRAASATQEYVSLAATDNTEQSWRMYFDDDQYVIYHNDSKADTQQQKRLKLHFQGATATGDYGLWVYSDSAALPQQEQAGTVTGQFVSQIVPCERSILQAQYDIGLTDGLAHCQQDSTAVNTEDSSTEQDSEDSTQLSIDQDTLDSLTQQVINQCQRSPSSCGILVNPPVEETIAACQRDPSVCGIQVNWCDSVEATRNTCQASPAHCGIDCQCPSTVQGHYDSNSGLLYLPQVAEAGDPLTAYKVYMEQISAESLSFSVVNIIPLP